MGVLRVRGAQQLRKRLVLATLAGSVLRVDDIRADDTAPGLRDYEAAFLRLLEKISHGCLVEINETGTKLKYKPGTLVGGRSLSHDCGSSRALGYFLEPLIVLGLFGKAPLSITLKGVTNDVDDPSVDTFRSATLPLFKRFGAAVDSLELKILSRGAFPLGGGEILLKVPIVPGSLSAVTWVDEGMVKRVRGTAYSTRVSPQMANRMIDAARGIFNKLLPDVYIFTDHYTGHESGRSPGYGISLVAETTSGCLLTAEKAASPLDRDASNGTEGDGPQLPEDVGTQAALNLLEEIKQGGVVDSTHQGLLFLLCALCDQDVSKIRVGRLSPQAIQTLRLIKEFLGVQFNIKPDLASGTVLLTVLTVIDIGSMAQLCRVSETECAMVLPHFLGGETRSIPRGGLLNFRVLQPFSTQLHTFGCHSKHMWVRCYPVLKGEGLSPSWKLSSLAPHSSAYAYLLASFFITSLDHDLLALQICITHVPFLR